MAPEGNLQDIAEAIEGFLEFYKQNVCFEPGSHSWTEWLLEKINVGEVSGTTLRRDDILIEGESAGGQAAATAMFINADTEAGTHIKLAVALLRYPMIKHYTRHFDEDVDIPFMEEVSTLAGRRDKDGKVGVSLREQAEDILKAIEWLEGQGYLPTRVNSSPPDKMPGAFLFSVTDMWKALLQRQHHGEELTDPVDIMDGLERAAYSADRVNHADLPPIYMYHGDADTNCLIGDTKKFEEILRDNYPTRYKAGTIYTYEAKGKAHAFDYDLVETKAGGEFLRNTYEFIDKYWAPKVSTATD